MKIFNLIILISLVPRLAAANELQIKLSSELENSHFCAICEPVDAGGYEKLLADKYPRLDFFRLRPLKIYWGSFETEKSSLALHPVLKKERKAQVLVIIRSEKNLGPGDWIKQYIPIQKYEQHPGEYLLSGELAISGDELKRILEKYSKEMQKKFPLDKKNNTSKNKCDESKSIGSK